ncbi:MAG: hypothetical protein N3A72_05670 [bacterium]|nr:hypothetical protein [bacterium]
MKRTRSTDLPYVGLRIPLKKFQQMVEDRFNQRIRKIELDSAKTKQVKTALHSAFVEIMAEKFAVDGNIELIQFPLGALSASGKFSEKDAGTIVYVPGTKKHKPYTRRWVIPPNPQTAKQQEHRALFNQVMHQWKNESDEIKAIWNQKAKKFPPLTGQNLYVKKWFELGKSTGTYPGLGFRL